MSGGEELLHSSVLQLLALAQTQQSLHRGVRERAGDRSRSELRRWKKGRSRNRRRTLSRRTIRKLIKVKMQIQKKVAENI